MTDQSKIAASQPFLPWELIDEILVEVGDTKLAIELERFSIALKIDPHFDYNWAIEYGHLNCLKYLNGRGLCVGDYNGDAVENYARNGNLDILKYCHRQIKPITARHGIMNSAAACGRHLDLVKYLNSIGSKCTTSAMN